LGSIPFGLLLAKLFGAGDLRRVGSGNIGATNVARAAGILPGVLTLLLDEARRGGGVPRTLLSPVAEIQGRQRRGNGGGSFSNALPGGSAWRRYYFSAGCGVLAVHFAGVPFRGGSHATVDLFLVGSAARAAACHHVRDAGHRRGYRVQA